MPVTYIFEALHNLQYNILNNVCIYNMSYFIKYNVNHQSDLLVLINSLSTIT